MILLILCAIPQLRHCNQVTRFLDGDLRHKTRDRRGGIG